MERETPSMSSGAIVVHKKECSPEADLVAAGPRHYDDILATKLGG